MDIETAKHGCVPGNEYLCRAINWVLATLPITVLVFGVAGNILSFVILSRKKLRSKPSFLYLRYICIFDSLFLTAALSRMMTLAYSKIDLNAVTSLFCKPITLIGLSSKTLSMYMIGLMSMERVIFIWLPLKARDLVTKRRKIAMIVIIIILTWTFNGLLVFAPKSDGLSSDSLLSDVNLTNTTLSFDQNKKLPLPTDYLTNKSLSDDQVTKQTTQNHEVTHAFLTRDQAPKSTLATILDESSTICHEHLTNCTLDDDLFTKSSSSDHKVTNATESKDQITNVTLYNLFPDCIDIGEGAGSIPWHIVGNIFTTGIPVMVLVISNTILVKTLFVRTRTVATLSESYSRNAAQNVGTKIVIVITMFYFLTTIPYYVVRLFFLPSGPVDENTAKSRLIGLVLDIWSFGNYSCNFLLYFWTGSSFRAEFWALLSDIARPCNRVENNPTRTIEYQIDLSSNSKSEPTDAGEAK